MSGAPVRQPHRVLVIDDYAPVAHAIEQLLQISGHTVRTLLDADDVVAHALAFGPDIILLDLGLRARDDGMDVARRLRAEPRLAGVVLVALTGRVELAGQWDPRKAGFDHYLVKPVGFDALERIMDIVERAPRRDEGVMRRPPDELEAP